MEAEGLRSGEHKSKLSHVCLMAHATILGQMSSCKAMGCTLDWDKDAGTLTIKYGDLAVVQAIQKGGSDSPWITNFYSTDTISWEKTDGI